MRHLINIEGIKLYAYHGCLEEEARIGGNYIVDVKILADFGNAVKSDDLRDTVDYCAVYAICRREMAIRSKLIEEVCHRIHTSLKKELNGVEGLHVKVTKLVPPMNGDVEKCSVEICDKEF